MLNEEASRYQSKGGVNVHADMKPLLHGRFLKAVAPLLVTFE
jgi:hypothetical protein